MNCLLIARCLRPEEPHIPRSTLRELSVQLQDLTSRRQSQQVEGALDHWRILYRSRQAAGRDWRLHFVVPDSWCPS